MIRKERFSAIAIPASHLSGVGGPAVGLLEGPAEPEPPVSEPSAREGSEAFEIACARNAVGRRALLTVGGVTCRGDGCRLCKSSIAHRRSGSTATLPRRKHSRAVRLVDVAHRVALLASDYSGSAQRTRARCSCSGHVRGERGGGARARFQARRRNESCDVPWSDIGPARRRPEGLGPKFAWCGGTSVRRGQPDRTRRCGRVAAPHGPRPVRPLRCAPGRSSGDRAIRLRWPSAPSHRRSFLCAGRSRRTFRTERTR